METGFLRKSFVMALRGMMLILAIAVWLHPRVHGDLNAFDDDTQFVPDQVVVKLDPASGASIEEINADFGTTTLEIYLSSAGIYLLHIASGQSVAEVVEEMEGDPRLLYAEPNFMGEMPEADPSNTWAWGGYDPDPYLHQYAAEMLNLAEAHTTTLGAGVVVAVLDTGVQLDHPRLAGRWTAARYDFVNDDPFPADEANGLDDDNDGLIDEGAGHGTHVAGIVNLVAPEAQIMPLRTLDSDGQGNTFVIAEAIQYAAANGAQVINLSLGTSVESELLADVIEDMVDTGIVIVAAAGNLDSSTFQYPAAEESVLAVTAVGPEAIKAPFANYGLWVDIAMPGQSITSTFPIDGYAQWSGTSMATAFASGQVTLLRSAFPSLPIADLFWLIQATSQPIDDLNPGYSSLLGTGLADIAASLRNTPVSCGQVLTTSLVVANNLVDCPGDGLIIGADGITVDLNGRTISGVGLGIGIRNDGFDSVTITNGTVQAFDFGVQLNAGTALNVISALTVQLNQEGGIQLVEAGDSAGGNTIQNNTVASNTTGIALVNGTQGTLVLGNTLDSSLSNGLIIENSNGNMLVGNSIADSADASVVLEDSSGNTLLSNIIVGPSDIAIKILVASNGNRVESNTITNGGDGGIFIEDSDDNQLISNIVHHVSDIAISLKNAHNSLVRANDLGFNGGGIELSDSSGNLLESNLANDSGETGIEVGDGSLGNILRLNTANNNATVGLAIAAEILPGSPTGLGNLLELNQASGNNGGGIIVSKAGHTLTANTAQNNIGWGIYAEPGNTSSGNTAAGNTEPLQCFNVTCNGTPPAPPDATPPDTILSSSPPDPGNDTSATFTFTGSDNNTLPGDLAFACRLDSQDELDFLPCQSPQLYAGLTPGTHTFEVRATDAMGNVDSTPASWTWTIPSPSPCGPALFLFAAADAWIEQNSPSNNKGDDTILKVKSQGPTDNFRTLVRFALPTMPAGCAVESAALRLYAPSWTAGRTLQAIRLSGSWSESTVTWGNQPTTAGSAAITSSGGGYREWNVAAQVQTMYDQSAHHGFLIRDASESASGAEQSFHSREEDEHLPMLVITFVAAGPADTTPPETTIDSGPGTTTTSTSATFTFSADEPGLIFDCSLDGAAFTVCVSPVGYTGLSVGVHTFAVRAVDQVGNADPTPASHTWTVETAPPPDCGDPVTLSATADAWIEQNSPSNNKGDDSILKVKSQSSSDNFRALVQFTLPVIPAGCLVESAALRLYAASWKNGRSLQAFQLTSSWSEMGVTWSNQPATTGPAATTSSGKGYRQWDVTTQMQAMITNGNYGFLIRDASEGGNGSEQQFHAREKGEQPPVLVISFAPNN